MFESKALFRSIATVTTLTVVFGFGLAVSQPTPAEAATAYSAKLVSRSPQLIRVRQGESFIIWARFKNTGTTPWYRDGNTPFRLGFLKDTQIKPSDEVNLNPSWRGYIAPFIYDSLEVYKWNNNNRVGMDQSVVDPGETAGFGLKLMATEFLTNPNATFQIKMAPVVDNLKWLKPTVTWKVQLRSLTSDEANNYPMVSPFKEYQQAFASAPEPPFKIVGPYSNSESTITLPAGTVFDAILSFDANANVRWDCTTDGWQRALGGGAVPGNPFHLSSDFPKWFYHSIYQTVGDNRLTLNCQLLNKADNTPNSSMPPYSVTIQSSADTNSGPATVGLSEADTGRVLQLKAGDRVNITLVSNASTGFSWRYHIEQNYSPSPVSLMSHKYINTSPPNIVGGGGIEKWEFIVNPGNYSSGVTLVFEYNQWWTGGMTGQTYTFPIVGSQ